MQPEAVERANHLLWAAHNLERYADRTINICERVEYMCTGVYREADTLEFGMSGVN
jgi:phosphate transport system protein